MNALQQNESNAKGNMAMFSPRKSFILLSPRKSITLTGGLDALKEELEEFDREESKNQFNKSTSFNQKGNLDSDSDSPSSHGFYKSQSVKGFNRIATNKKIPKIVSEKLKKVISDTHTDSSHFSGIDSVDSTNATPSQTPNETPNQTPSISQQVSPIGDSLLSSPRSSNAYTDRKLDSPPFGEEIKLSPSEESKTKDAAGIVENLLSMSPDEDNAFSYILSPTIDKEKGSPVPKLKLSKKSETNSYDVIEDVTSPLNSARDEILSPMISPTFSSPRISIQKLTSQHKFDFLTVQDVETTLINLQNKIVILVGEGEYDEAKKVIDLMKGITEKFAKGDKKNLDNVMKKARKIE